MIESADELRIRNGDTLIKFKKKFISFVCYKIPVGELLPP